MQLSIIIVSYNTCQLTLQTVKSVYQSLLPESPLKNNFEIIIVDNDSHDHTLAELRKLKQSNLKLIASQENLGFGRANNLGFASSTGQYILFLNSDTIVQTGALEQLISYYQAHRRDKKPLGLLAAQLLNSDGSFQPQGGDTPSLLTLSTTFFFLDDLPLLRRFLPSVQHTGRRFNPQEVTGKKFISKAWVGGTAVLIYRELLEDFGGWDPQIFMYGEDQELAHRLHLHHYQHGICTSARIIHLGSASSSSQNALCGELKGYFYFFRLYRPQQLVYLKALLWLAILWRIFIFTFVRKDTARSQAYLKALSIIEQEKVS